MFARFLCFGPIISSVALVFLCFYRRKQMVEKKPNTLLIDHIKFKFLWRVMEIKNMSRKQQQ
jgi:hypothetical protein